MEITHDDDDDDGDDGDDDDDDDDGDDGDDDDDDLASEKVARSDSISGILAALSYEPTNRLTPTVVQEGLVQSI